MNRFLEGLIVGLRYIKNDKFKRWIDGYGETTAMYFEQRGTAAFGKIVYFVGMEDLNGNEQTMGFFALFNCVLNRLYYADRLGLCPYVNYPNTVIYYDKEYGENVWLYYFKPVSDIQYKDVENASNLVISEEKDSQFNLQGKTGYELDNQGIVNLSYVLKKYVHLNENMYSYLIKSWETLNLDRCTHTGIFLGGGVLGVHIRGTDFKDVNKNHPVGIHVEQYIEKIQEVFKKGKYKYIFLATDENDVCIKMEDIFGKDNICYYQDVLRSTDGRPVHKSHNERKHHKYLLGAEVLRDVYTLAKCDGFIAGKSQVSLAVRILKESCNEQWIDLWILDNGMYKRGKA